MIKALLVLAMTIPTANENRFDELFKEADKAFDIEYKEDLETIEECVKKLKTVEL